jgi:acetoacetate decarboxylase
MIMVKIDSEKIWMMPLIMGPVAPERQNRVGSVYGEVEWIGLQYETDPDALRAVLPECYRPAEKPMVAVVFCYNDGVDFLAGRGYRIAMVSVGARFDGEQDHVEGDYALVMCEDEPIAIITGREWHGIHKVFADISPLKTLPSGHLRCDVSLWGHMLFGVDLASLKEQNLIVRSVAAKEFNKRPMLGYKYISCMDGPPDAAYPNMMPNELKVEQFWMGKSGQVLYGDPKEEDIGSTVGVLAALKTLPVREVTQTFRLRGSAVLRSDLSRRLR